MSQENKVIMGLSSVLLKPKERIKFKKKLVDDNLSVRGWLTKQIQEYIK